MARFLKNISATLGLSPDEAVFVGKKVTENTTIEVIDVTPKQVLELFFTTIEEFQSYEPRGIMTWVNVTGLHNAEMIKEITLHYDAHPLMLGDILNTGQRPRMVEYEHSLFMVMKMMTLDPCKKKVLTEQVSLYLDKSTIITFQERPGDVFEPVRDRIRQNAGKHHHGFSVDYVAYMLLDAVLDTYLTIVESLGEQIEDIEVDIFDNFSRAILSDINGFKREMNYLRKNLRPTRDFIAELTVVNSKLLKSTTVPFVKDLLDLSNQSFDVVNTYRDVLSDLLAVYNSEVSNRTNEIITFLTIFSSIFIPLTFIAGIYGTNFEYFPELGYRYAYYIFWGVLVTIGLGMVGLFKKKKWL